MVNGVERAQGGRIIPGLRYRNGQAAIDWLCKAFGFEKRMVPGEGGRIAHAELVLENGMIMVGDSETEYGRFVRAPEPPERINTQGIYVVVADNDGHYARAKADPARHQDPRLWRARLYLPRSRGQCLDLRHLRPLGELSSRSEGLFQERAAEAQTLTVDAVADPLRQVPLDGKACLRELLAGDEHGIDRYNLVHVAVDEKDGRRRCRVLG
jgi:uncharacterized glyoxalase superfamily protein PhnB